MVQSHKYSLMESYPGACAQYEVAARKSDVVLRNWRALPISIALIALMLLLSTAVFAQQNPDSSAVMSKLPREEGRSELVETCSQCHSLSVVISEGHSLSGWYDVLNKMQTYGAVFTQDEAGLIAGYLAGNFPAEGKFKLATVLEKAKTGGPTRYSPPNGEAQWPAYGGGGANQNFSPLTQIDRGNVSDLQVAWVYHYGVGDHDAGDQGLDYRFEITPLVIGNVMYVSTPSSPLAPNVPSSITALNATTGKVIWKFKSPLNIHGRGIAYWPGDENTAPRIFFGTSAGYLMAVDVTTGTLAPGFGRDGVIDAYVGVAPANVGESRRSNYTIPNPVTIYKDLVITSSRPGETGPPGPRGDIRAFDARTGRLVWTFHTAPLPGEPFDVLIPEPSENYGATGANVWSTMTLDARRGILYAPTGNLNAREVEGKQLFANSLLALDASTGKLLWFHQIVHKDIWDWDSPTPPVLFALNRNNDKVPTVLLTGKQGLVFLFNRINGQPLNGFAEQQTPRTNVPGLNPWPTQPFPAAPGPIARTGMMESEIPDLVPGMRKHCRAIWDKYDPVNTGLYGLPLADRATITGPGPTGGPNWGGGSYSSELGYYFINVQNRLRFRLPKGGDSQGRGRASFSYTYNGLELPCSPTPWGELVAVDVRNLRVAWRSPLGITPELGQAGLKTGAPNLGGNIVTATGLIFIGASNDSRFRAFDARTGEMLWVTKLPADAHSTPVTYMGEDGRQYVVVAAGGGTSVGGPHTSDSLVAFALP